MKLNTFNARRHPVRSLIPGEAGLALSVYLADKNQPIYTIPYLVVEAALVQQPLLEAGLLNTALNAGKNYLQNMASPMQKEKLDKLRAYAFAMTGPNGLKTFRNLETLVSGNQPLLDNNKWWDRLFNTVGIRDQRSKDFVLNAVRMEAKRTAHQPPPLPQRQSQQPPLPQRQPPPLPQQQPPPLPKTPTDRPINAGSGTPAATPAPTQPTPTQSTPTEPTQSQPATPGKVKFKSIDPTPTKELGVKKAGANKQIAKERKQATNYDAELQKLLKSSHKGRDEAVARLAELQAKLTKLQNMRPGAPSAEEFFQVAAEVITETIYPNIISNYILNKYNIKEGIWDEIGRTISQPRATAADWRRKIQNASSTTNNKRLFSVAADYITRILEDRIRRAGVEPSDLVAIIHNLTGKESPAILNSYNEMIQKIGGYTIPVPSAPSATPATSQTTPTNVWDKTGGSDFADKYETPQSYEFSDVAEPHIPEPLEPSTAQPMVEPQTAIEPPQSYETTDNLDDLDIVDNPPEPGPESYETTDNLDDLDIVDNPPEPGPESYETTDDLDDLDIVDNPEPEPTEDSNALMHGLNDEEQDPASENDIQPPQSYETEEPNPEDESEPEDYYGRPNKRRKKRRKKAREYD